MVRRNHTQIPLSSHSISSKVERGLEFLAIALSHCVCRFHILKSTDLQCEWTFQRDGAPTRYTFTAFQSLNETLARKCIDWRESVVLFRYNLGEEILLNIGRMHLKLIFVFCDLKSWKVSLHFMGMMGDGFTHCGFNSNYDILCLSSIINNNFC